MDNFSNTSLNIMSPLSGPGFVVFNVVLLLGVVLPVIAVNTALLVALVLESSIVKVVRLVLGSILVSCIIVALGLAVYHIAGIILSFAPVDNPPTAPCTITVYLIAFGGAARLVFMAMFAVVIYEIVRFGKATKNHIVLAILVSVVALWVITFLGTMPLSYIIPTVYWDSLTCGVAPVNISFAYLGLYVLVFCVSTLSVTIVFLVITASFLRCHSSTDVKKAMIKFGFFLLLGNGIAMIGPLIGVIIIAVDSAVPTEEGSPNVVPEWNYIPYTFFNAALIPTPIFVLIYFKPIRETLRHWLCCCMSKKWKTGSIHKSSNVDGSKNTHATEMVQ